METIDEDMVMKQIREDLEQNPKTPLIEREICRNNPDAKFTITDELNLGEDEAIVCLGVAGGEGIGPKFTTWNTIRFDTKGLDTATLEERVAGIISLILVESAKHFRWVKEESVWS